MTATGLICKTCRRPIVIRDGWLSREFCGLMCQRRWMKGQVRGHERRELAYDLTFYELTPLEQRLADGDR
jgi:hypothetical protein